jgi:multisubunit Na+/H+ antiporter MnhC subunit
MNKDRIRNLLNLIFMILAVIGVILFLQKNEERHMMGLYIILIAMSVKIVEASMRMIK